MSGTLSSDRNYYTSSYEYDSRDTDSITNNGGKLLSTDRHFTEAVQHSATRVHKDYEETSESYDDNEDVSYDSASFAPSSQPPSRSPSALSLPHVKNEDFMSGTVLQVPEKKKKKSIWGKMFKTSKSSKSKSSKGLTDVSSIPATPSVFSQQTPTVVVTKYPSRETPSFVASVAATQPDGINYSRISGVTGVSGVAHVPGFGDMVAAEEKKKKKKKKKVLCVDT
eukprot:Lankesteria_metandrocarpae@DN10102_c0_g1_i2.p1